MIISVLAFEFYGLLEGGVEVAMSADESPFPKSKMKQLDFLTCISCVFKGLILETYHQLFVSTLWIALVGGIIIEVKSTLELQLCLVC